jgi:hypothetical protein
MRRNSDMGRRNLPAAGSLLLAAGFAWIGVQQAHGFTGGASEIDVQDSAVFSGVVLDSDPSQQAFNVGGPTTPEEDLPISLNATAGKDEVAASMTGEIIAKYGQLSVSMNATGGEGPYPSVGRAVIVPTFEGYTGGSPKADFRDNLTITGPTGATVSVTIGESLTGTVTTDQYSSASLSAAYQTGYSHNGGDVIYQPVTDLVWNGTTNNSETLILSVGDRLTVFGSLYADGSINGNAMPGNPGGLIYSSFTIGSAAAPANAGEVSPAALGDAGAGTMSISLPPGYGYVADSGTVYATGTPEPASLAILGAGALIAASRRKRRGT